MISPREYQARATKAAHDAIARGRRRILQALATGLGKSVIAAMLIRERGGRALLLAHRDELCRQLMDKVRTIWSEVRVGVVKAEEDDYRAQVVVASVQTLVRPSRLARLIGRDGQAQLFHDGPPAFTTVIVDECHHAPDESYLTVLRGLGCFEPDGPVTVGYTATPERADEKGLAEVFEEIVFEMGILDGIRQGYLCNLRARQIKLAADFSKLHVRAGEFRDDETADMLMEADAPNHAAQAYADHAKGRPALLFTPTVAVAAAMEQAFRGLGIAAEHAHGEMPIEQRRAILGRLSSGETLVVPNAALFTEGTDLPNVACIIVAKPTRSRPAYVQMVGRGTRLYPGKVDTLILDLVGVATRHDLTTMATLFDVPPEATEQGVLQAVERKAAGAGQREAPQDGRLVSVDVDLFAARAFVWVQAGLRFILQLGEEDVVLEPSSDPSGAASVGATWDVFRVRRVKVSAPGARLPRYQEERKKLYAGLDIGYGMGVAEDYARKSAGSVLVRKDVSWRKDAATDKQRARLEKWGLWREGLTKGEATDIIGRRIAQRAYGGFGRARRSA